MIVTRYAKPVRSRYDQYIFCHRKTLFHVNFIVHVYKFPDVGKHKHSYFDEKPRYCAKSLLIKSMISLFSLPLPE